MAASIKGWEKNKEGSSSPPPSSSSSISTTACCGLWPVEQYPAIFSYLSPTVSISSLLALEDPVLPLLSFFSWVQGRVLTTKSLPLPHTPFIQHCTSFSVLQHIEPVFWLLHFTADIEQLYGDSDYQLWDFKADTQSAEPRIGMES
jgi:hypothetical protein